MICPNCQQEIPNTANACGYCGHWLAPAHQEIPTVKGANDEVTIRKSVKNNLPWLWIGLSGVVLVIIVGAVGYLIGGGGGSRNAEATLVAVAATATEQTKTALTPPTPTSADTPLPPAPTPILALGIGSTRIREADSMTMVYVPGGTFQMGSDTGQNDEKPPHEVTLDAFWLDQTEVTNAQYNRCVEAGKCQASAYANDSQWNGANYPVVGVSWQDAANYCHRVGGRLLTEAEWEYAARGPENRVYPWGNKFDPVKVNAVGKDDDFDSTAPVGSYPSGASWVGALDLAGNVWEWCNDWYGDNYYANSSVKNPSGPDAGTSRVLRGGSWGSNGDNIRLANRDNDRPVSRNGGLGFRCGMSPDN